MVVVRLVVFVPIVSARAKRPVKLWWGGVGGGGYVGGWDGHSMHGQLAGRLISNGSDKQQPTRYAHD
jgi:hypothetical protein